MSDTLEVIWYCDIELLAHSKTTKGILSRWFSQSNQRKQRRLRIPNWDDRREIRHSTPHKFRLWLLNIRSVIFRVRSIHSSFVRRDRIISTLNIISVKQFTSASTVIEVQCQKSFDFTICYLRSHQNQFTHTLTKIVCKTNNSSTHVGCEERCSWSITLVNEKYLLT